MNSILTEKENQLKITGDQIVKTIKEVEFFEFFESQLLLARAINLLSSVKNANNLKVLLARWGEFRIYSLVTGAELLSFKVPKVGTKFDIEYQNYRKISSEEDLNHLVFIGDFSSKLLSGELNVNSFFEHVEGFDYETLTYLKDFLCRLRSEHSKLNHEVSQLKKSSIIDSILSGGKMWEFTTVHVEFLFSRKAGDRVRHVAGIKVLEYGKKECEIELLRRNGHVSQHKVRTRGQLMWFLNHLGDEVYMYYIKQKIEN